jgi:general secretion pathway protein G
MRHGGKISVILMAILHYASKQSKPKRPFPLDASILVLIAVLALVAFRFLGVRRESLSGKPTAAIYRMRDIARALQSFESDCGRFPTSAEGLQALLKCPPSVTGRWKGPYLSDLEEDPWEHAFLYACSGSPNAAYQLSSAGPDGVPGTSDDIPYAP